MEKRKKKHGIYNPRKENPIQIIKIAVKKKEIQGKKKKNWPQMDLPILVVIWWLMGWKVSNSKPIYKKIKSVGFKSKGMQLNVLMGERSRFFDKEMISQRERMIDCWI